MNDFLLIIDGNSLLTTAYHGTLPNVLKSNNLTPQQEEQHYSEIMHTSDGKYTNAIYGFMRTLLSLIKNQNPKYIVVTWDAGRNTFRKTLYPEYKGTRKPTARPLKEQQEMMRSILKFIGIKQFMNDIYEADDFSGSLAKLYEQETYIRILTKDRDHLQLVNDKVNIWLPFPMDKNGICTQADTLNAKFGIDKSKLCVPQNVFRVTKDLVKPYYGTNPEYVADLKALWGDVADNIPGVNGVGEKSAILLINEFGTIENLYKFIESNPADFVIPNFKSIGIRGAKKIYEALTQESDTEIVGREMAFLCKNLATIRTDINFGNLPLSTFETSINETNLIASLQRLEFKKLLTEYYPNI